MAGEQVEDDERYPIIGLLFHTFTNLSYHHLDRMSRGNSLVTCNSGSSTEDGEGGRFHYQNACT